MWIWTSLGWAGISICLLVVVAEVVSGGGRDPTSHALARLVGRVDLHVEVGIQFLVKFLAAEGAVHTVGDSVSWILLAFHDSPYCVLSCGELDTPVAACVEAFWIFLCFLWLCLPNSVFHLPVKSQCPHLNISILLWSASSGRACLRIAVPAIT